MRKHYTVPQLTVDEIIPDTMIASTMMNVTDVPGISNKKCSVSPSNGGQNCYSSRDFAGGWNPTTQNVCTG